MRKTITQCFCDVCNSEESVRTESIQVIFTTEQTEGKSTSPYLYNVKMDICKVCLSHILSGNMLFGHGAQGNNKFYFKKDK